MCGQVGKSNVGANQIAEVLGSLRLGRLYDGKDSSQEHALPIELLHVLLRCCSSSLVRVSIIDTRALSQLTCFAGIALITLSASQSSQRQDG